MCDCEYPRISINVVRKARKSHVCYECSSIINPKEEYEESRYLHDDGWTNVKLCSLCSELSKWLLESTDCCYSLGQLLQEFINSDDIVRQYPNARSVKDRGDWISNNPELEVISQQPLRVKVITKELAHAK